MRRLFSVILLLTVVCWTQPSHAQEGGLSEEQLTLLERLLTALAQPYASYRLESTNLNTQIITITIPNEFSGTAIQNNSRVINRVKVGNDLSAQVTATASYREPEADTPFSYTINAEIRRVNQLLYANAAYETALTDLPILPSGWVTIENPADWPALTELALADYLPRTDQSRPTLEDLLTQDRALVEQIITDIQATPSTLTDGTPVDIITLKLDFQAILASDLGLDYSAATLDAVTLGALLSDATIQFTAAFTLNSQGQVIGRQVVLTIQAEGIDAAALSADIPAGTTIDLSVTQTENSFYTRINDPTLPVIEAPLDAP